MTERQFHTPDFETSHAVPSLKIARLALIKGESEIAQSLGIEAQEYESSPLPTNQEKEFQSEAPSYTRTHFLEYARANNISDAKAGNAHAAMYGELFYRRNDKPFRQLLEDQGIAVGYNDIARSEKDRQNLNLPVDILLNTLLTLVPENLDEDEQKRLLRENFALIRLAAYKIFVGYCKTTLEERQSDSE